jgi:hypothetical protein
MALAHLFGSIKVLSLDEERRASAKKLPCGSAQGNLRKVRRFLSG